MHTYMDVAIRAMMSYLTLLLLARLMGKREISQMTFFDYIVGITLGSITAQMSTMTMTAWIDMVPAAIIFTLFQIISAVFSQRSIKFRSIVNGSPTVLIKEGKILEKNMIKEKVSMNEFMAKLREKNAFILADIETAILEVDGQVSVQLKSGKRPATPSDLNLSVPYSGLPRLVIQDGNVLSESLRDIGLTRAWLLTKLAEQNVQDTSKVVLAQVDTSGNLYVDLYNDSQN